MPHQHEKFHSKNGKRQILIIEDELVNRELLKSVLEEEYDVLTAEDGERGLAMIRANRETLSLVLLDLLMPALSGTEVLKLMREDISLHRIPVIVMTADQMAEIECLKLGASDFIPKPYPPAGVIQARVFKTIELSEDRQIIQSTERDPLTGLYNRDFFYSYADQFDLYHKDQAMDAIMLDINHFHTINERFGKAFGDDVLRYIGRRLREMMQECGGIVCRRSADTFMIYCPHRETYKEILETASAGLASEGSEGKRVVRLRMGVYSNVDKSIDVERRFDRAKIAADSIKGSFTRTIAMYDSVLHERELYEEQLAEDFRRAIDEEQFRVYFQPKYDIRPDKPQLFSAEALVRWRHPKLGMISPGVFIPLFEQNGMISELDAYVWRHAARQIAAWREKSGMTLPVSVNVSRIDLYDPDLIKKLQEILFRYELTAKDLMLEVTESAYTQDSEQIVETICRLRDLGFRIEMDDFGTGYSSLNMISTLPIDSLKLDMQFIRNAFQEGGDTRMLEVVIDIADCLSVPVIAEGVETAEQMEALKTMGCDLAQGYYFSRPVPPEEFERFITARMEDDAAAALEAQAKEAQEKERQASFLQEVIESDRKAQAADREEAPAAEPEPEEVLPAETKGKGPRMRTLSLLFVIIAFLASAAVFFSGSVVTRGYQHMEAAYDRYITAQQAAADMESGSDYLTDRVRCFVMTGERTYLENFFEEVNVTKRRDKALVKLEELTEGSESSAYTSLAAALSLSNELVKIEYKAMRLAAQALEIPLAELPAELASVSLSEAELALSPDEQCELGRQMVFDHTYTDYKAGIRENVRFCSQALISSASSEMEQAVAQMNRFLLLQNVLTILLLLIVLAIVVFISTQIRKPLMRMVEKMQHQRPVQPAGAEELRFVTRTYNEVLEENKTAHEQLSYEASHDALTGLFNRRAYEMLSQSIDKEHIALLIVDVYKFKRINDTFGHDMGDRVLKRVADILRHSFRSVDLICRIGGDEFAVIMTRANSSMRQLVINKIGQANDLLENPKDGLPVTHLSVGVAFSDRENAQGDIFKDADTALYRVKNGAGYGCEVF